MYKIRQATKDDVEALVSMSLSFYNYSGYQLDIEEDKVRETCIWYVTRDPLEGVVFILTYAGEPVGMIALMAAPAFFFSGKMALEQVWWVEEEHRGKYSLYLLQLAEDWARAVGCKTMSMTALERNSAVTKIYERRGYKLTELTYFKEL